MDKITPILKKAFKGRIAIVGIGNRLKGDDGFGPIAVERLKQKVKASFFDVGVAPENFMGPVTKTNPETIIILDAADLGMRVGSLDILDKESILKVGFSTHDASPRMFMDFLRESTGARIFMIAVQPKDTQFGTGLSVEVKQAIDDLEGVFTEIGGRSRDNI